MLHLALDEVTEHLDVIITKEGDVRQVMRPLSIKERIELLKACASYYAPTLKSVEATAKLDLDSMSLDQLKAKLMTTLADAVKAERKSH